MNSTTFKNVGRCPSVKPVFMKMSSHVVNKNNFILLIKEV